MGVEVDPNDPWHIWAAGFIDGEGSLDIRQNREHSYQVIVTASQTKEAPIAKLSAMYGGSCYELNRKTSTGKTVYRWQLKSASQLRIVLPIWVPYLMVKQEEALILLNFCNLVGNRGNKVVSHNPFIASRRLELSKAIRDERRKAS